MLHILFLILKIIGILLLCLLGLLILLVLAVLFVPVRYHAEGESRTASPGTYIKGTVSWLLHLVHFSAVYQNGETSLRVRLLGIPLWKNGAEKSPGHSRKSRKEKPSEPSPKDEDQDAQEQAEADQQALDEPVTTETELSCPQQQEEAGEEKEQWASPGLWSRIREKGKAFFAIPGLDRDGVRKAGAVSLRTGAEGFS